MVAYGFKPEFVELVRSGRKSQTIRKPREGKSRHARPGEPIQLYENWRQPDARKIIEDPVCVTVDPVLIRWNKTTFWSMVRTYDDSHHYNWWNAALDDFARADGFVDHKAFFQFFEDTHGLPFEGVLIKWEPPKAQRE